MKKLLLPLSVLFTLNLASLPVHAAVITLKDGSVVHGEVVSLNNGTYVINTTNMGQVSTPAQNVASIAENQAAAPATEIPANTNIKSLPEFQTMQNKIVSNPEAMADIQKLMEDPEVMSIISDPAFIAAVQSGNVASLQSDPRLQKLANNPKIQALMQKVSSQ
jgi:hypothetical protein